MTKNKIKNIRTSVALIFILAMAAFLRLLTLNKLMVFTPDEEYVLYITQTLVRHIHIIWIGVSALGFDFYMGPGLNYFLVPFIWFFKGDPIVWGIITSVFGVVTAGLVYFLGQKIFNRKTAILASIFYAVSALLVFYDQQPYPTAVPLLSVLMLIAIYETKKSKWWWVAFSFLYGMVFHLHLSMVLAIIVALYWAVSHRKTWNIKILLLSAFVFVLTVSPLIGFNYYHNWSDLTAPLRVISSIGNNKRKFDLPTRTQTLSKTISRLFYLENGRSNTDEILYPCNALPYNNSTKVVWLIVILLVLLILYLFSRRNFWKGENNRLLVVFSLVYLVPFIFLSSVGSVEYYLLGFFPVFFILIAHAIDELPLGTRRVLYLFVFLFIVHNVMTVFSANGDYGLAVKKKMVTDVMGYVGKSSFTLTETGGACQGTAGWGYLFSVYGRAPDNNVADRQFSWLIAVGNKEKTDYEVVINESRFPRKETGYDYKFVEGGFETFVFNQK